MRKLLCGVVAIASLNVSAQQYEFAPIDGVKAAVPILIVEPQYPQEQLVAGVEATFDAVLQVDKRMSVVKVEVQSPLPPRGFVEALETATQLWLVAPGVDRCQHTVSRVQMRVWFEVKDGKPSFSFSIPAQEHAPSRQDESLYKRTSSGYEARYPSQAMRQGVSRGYVFSSFRVNKVGDVELVTVHGATHEAFGRETERAIKDWKFPPDQRENAPARCLSVRFDFFAQRMTSQ